MSHYELDGFGCNQLIPARENKTGKQRNQSLTGYACNKNKIDSWLTDYAFPDKDPTGHVLITPKRIHSFDCSNPHVRFHRLSFPAAAAFGAKAIRERQNTNTQIRRAHRKESAFKRWRFHKAFNGLLGPKLQPVMNGFMKDVNSSRKRDVENRIAFCRAN